MRGRKRHRKKDEKRRGVYGLPFRVAPKRKRDQAVADALAKAMSYKFEQNIRDVVALAMQRLTSPIPRASEILKENAREVAE